MLANLILDSLKSAPFKSAWLNIEMASDVIGINGEYIDMNNNEEDIEVETEIRHFNVVKRIKELTTSHPIKHTKWNRAKFTIYPEGKFNMEFVWDQDLQNEVDRYSNVR